MWIFLTIADQADEDDVADIMEATKKFVQDPSKEETSFSLTIHSAASGKRAQDTFMLPFFPLATCYTTGPASHGSIERKSQYYLARNPDGRIVKKLVSQWKVHTKSDGSTEREVREDRRTEEAPKQTAKRNGRNQSDAPGRSGGKAAKRKSG